MSLKSTKIEKENQVLLELKNMSLKTKRIQAKGTESGLETGAVGIKVY